MSNEEYEMELDDFDLSDLLQSTVEEVISNMLSDLLDISDEEYQSTLEFGNEKFTAKIIVQLNR